MGDNETGRTTLEPRSARENPEQFYARAELRKKLIEALGQLDPSLRCVCLLRDVGNLSTEETAAHLGLTPQAVQNQIIPWPPQVARTPARIFLFSVLEISARAAMPEAAYGD